MLYLLYAFLTLWTQVSAVPRPTRFVVVNSSGKHKDIQLFNTRHGAEKYLTQTAVEETALICRNKKVIFVAGDQIQSVDLDRPKQETNLGTLPKELVSAMGPALRHFLRFSPDGTYLAWPGASDIQIHGIGKTFVKNITPDPGTRIVHPVFWRPDSTEIVYVTQNPAGTVWVHFHPLSRVDPRLSLAAVSGTKGSVSAFDLHFSADGKLAALNMDIVLDPRKTVRYFLVLDVETGRLHTLSPSWKLEKFHGFSSKGELVLSGRLTGNNALYYWNPANPKSPHLVENLLKREVYDYFPGMDITLMHTAGQKCAERARLISLTRHAQDHRLLKWAEWAEVLALDPSRVWGLFRAGGTCNDTRPALYLMKMDGSGLLDEMPRRKFSVLQSIIPEQISFCD
ncbi:hypothetical protein KKD52_07055 [Myxococcota bacterium]|nr:hypothetical protein [Myxococcota bacterium]MBU1510103.1 hypothetical protein [Myxococcota bacterium]